MAHVRTQIRDEIEQLLIAEGVPTRNLSVSRVYTAQISPYVIIYTGAETGISDVMAIPSTSHRELTVTIEIYSKAGSDLFDKEIDDLAITIEKALAPDGNKFRMCKTWEYQALNMEYSKESEKAGGVATIEYVFTYRVNEADPETGD